MASRAPSTAGRIRYDRQTSKTRWTALLAETALAPLLDAFSFAAGAVRRELRSGNLDYRSRAAAGTNRPGDFGDCVLAALVGNCRWSATTSRTGLLVGRIGRLKTTIRNFFP